MTAVRTPLFVAPGLRTLIECRFDAEGNITRHRAVLELHIRARDAAHARYLAAGLAEDLPPVLREMGRRGRVQGAVHRTAMSTSGEQEDA
jgi:hypothetical protein